MRYRVITDCEEVIVITEDGGVVCIRENIGDDYIATTDYYQTHFTQEMLDNNNLWEEVGEGKMYCDDWDTPYTDSVHVRDALEWLCYGETDFEVDETIWEDFQ